MDQLRKLRALPVPAIIVRLRIDQRHRRRRLAGRPDVATFHGTLTYDASSVAGG